MSGRVAGHAVTAIGCGPRASMSRLLVRWLRASSRRSLNSETPLARDQSRASSVASAVDALA